VRRLGTELVAYAKANPGKLNYSAGSTPSSRERDVQADDGHRYQAIPYKGSAASITAVIAGDVQDEPSSIRLRSCRKFKGERCGRSR